MILKNFTQEDGLPSNETYCALKDRKGYMWIGTDKGVTRYNGSTFQKFDLPDNVVFKIKEAKDGKIWFFTYTGKLSYFFNEVIYSYKYNDSIQKYAQRILITDGFIYNNDSLYIKSSNKFDYTISNKGKVSLVKNISTENNLKTEREITIHNYDNIELKVTHFNNPIKNLNQKVKLNINTSFLNKSEYISNTSKPIFKASSAFFNSKNIFLFALNHYYKLSENNHAISKKFNYSILAHYFDKESKLIWLGFENNGFCIIDENINIVHENKLNNSTVSSITKDINNNIWITTTTSGIFLLKNQVAGYSKSNWLTTSEAHKIVVLNNELIFGNKKGLFILNGNVEQNLFKDSTGLLGDLQITHNKTILWASSSNLNQGSVIERVVPLKNKINFKVVKFNISSTLKFLCDSSVTVVSPSGIIFLPANINFSNLSNKAIENIYAIDKVSNKRSDKFHEVYFDSIFVKNVSILNCNNLLLGTLNNLYKYEISSNKAAILIPQTNIFKKGINYITPFKNNIQAIGIRFGGLALIKDTSILTIISEQNGLIDNSINYILADSNTLWLATNKGISAITFYSFSPVKYSIKNFSNEIGLGNEIIYQLVKNKSTLLAATSKGIFQLINADSLLGIKPKPIPFYITTISSSIGDTANIKSLSLPFSKNRISISFNAIEFNTNKDLVYFYRIINTDTTWRKLSNPELFLQDLSPGIYNIELKAVLPKQGRESDTEKFVLTIDKPWWQKIGVIALAIMILISSIYFYTTWRIKKARNIAMQKSLLDTRILKLEQAALRSQMNPHFIFNCLTSIQQLVNSNNKDEANEYLVKFSRLIRKTLAHSSKDYITVAEEIEYIEEYAALEQLRSIVPFKLTISTDNALNKTNIELPSMLLQPIVENAIRHGVRSLVEKQGIISINFQLNKDVLICMVKDNGIGISTSINVKNKFAELTSHKSYGLDIIKQRLAAFSESEMQKNKYKIETKDDNGTLATLYTPYKHKII